ncbi:hypothetical protein [Arthrobacter sp. ISL-30]|uniref:hypothetical protein n=1 Tax=Arthrobacter sp. ISL-30 TaxID=2819109 RepID=UPI001BEA054E|nr:hypothetical protein [Arthrobacter sp. ISL-30]MBT2514621.1 hypothetical protein [Arthrobacter sp. ISL-30]
MAQEETGVSRPSARSSAAKAASGGGGGSSGSGKPEEGKGQSNRQTQDQSADQAAAAALMLAAAQAFAEQMAGVMRDVFTEQRSIFAEQAQLREADYTLVRQMLEEQRQRQATDAMLLEKIEKQASGKRREHYEPQPGNIRPGQLRIGIQFNALSNALGSRKRTGPERDGSLIPPPEIRRVVMGGTTRYLLRFLAALPPTAETVLVRFLDGSTGGDRVDKLADNSLEITSDQVQTVELLDGRDLPIALGLPYRG